LLHEKNDGQAFRWDLYGAKRNAFGNHLPGASPQYGGAFQTKAHAIGLLADTISGRVEGVLG
jgi:hypothetical protein